MTNYNIELGNKIIIRMLSFIFATLRETQTMKADFRMRKKKTDFLPVCLNTISRTLKIYSRILNLHMNYLFMNTINKIGLKTPISVEKFVFTFF